MNTQQTPENHRETPVAKNVIQIGNGQLIGILGTFVAMLGVFVAVAVFGFRAIDAQFDAIDAQFDAVSVQFDAVSVQFDAVNARIDDLATSMNARIDDNTAELRLIRGSVQDLTERMAAVETYIGLRSQAETDGDNNQVAAAAPRDQG